MFIFNLYLIIFCPYFDSTGPSMLITYHKSQIKCEEHVERLNFRFQDDKWRHMDRVASCVRSPGFRR